MAILGQQGNLTPWKYLGGATATEYDLPYITSRYKTFLVMEESSLKDFN